MNQQQKTQQLTYQQLLINEPAKAMYKATKQQFNRERAICQVMRHFGCTRTAVLKCLYYWG